MEAKEKLELIKGCTDKLKQLIPYHILPYNLGDEGQTLSFIKTIIQLIDLPTDTPAPTPTEEQEVYKAGLEVGWNAATRSLEENKIAAGLKPNPEEQDKEVKEDEDWLENNISELIEGVDVDSEGLINRNELTKQLFGIALRYHARNSTPPLPEGELNKMEQNKTI